MGQYSLYSGRVVYWRLVSGQYSLYSGGVVEAGEWAVLTVQW